MLDAGNIADEQADTAGQELLAAERHVALREAVSHLPSDGQRLTAVLIGPGGAVHRDQRRRQAQMRFDHTRARQRARAACTRSWTFLISSVALFTGGLAVAGSAAAQPTSTAAHATSGWGAGTGGALCGS